MMRESDSFRFETGDALLVVDVINDFDHDDGRALLESFTERLVTMQKAIAAARASDIPVLYVNDAHGRWDGDVQALLRGAHEAVRSLTPGPADPFVLKHRYSGFDHTPLDLLLGELRVERIVLSGAATEGCVVQTAIDAREHGLKATILADACATTSEELERVALEYAERVGGIRVARLG
jgi:nicotinamidase-related amidase